MKRWAVGERREFKEFKEIKEIKEIKERLPKFSKFFNLPKNIELGFHYLYLRSAESSDPLRSVAGACFDLFVLILFRSLRPFGCVLFVA